MSASFDLADPAFVADPYPALAAARKQGPVLWHDGLGLWLTTSHAAASGLLRDRRLGRILRPRSAGDRNPAVFADPGRFLADRDPNLHLASGAGIHFCLGAPLARMELRISTRALLERLAPLEVVEAVRRPTFVLRGYERLVVTRSGRPGGRAARGSPRRRAAPPC